MFDVALLGPPSVWAAPPGDVGLMFAIAAAAAVATTLVATSAILKATSPTVVSCSSKTTVFWGGSSPAPKDVRDLFAYAILLFPPCCPLSDSFADDTAATADSFVDDTAAAAAPFGTSFMTLVDACGCLLAAFSLAAPSDARYNDVSDVDGSLAGVGATNLDVSAWEN